MSINDDDRETIESALSQYRESTGKSSNLDNPAKSLIRSLGDDEDILSSLGKLNYALGIVSDIDKNIDLTLKRKGIKK